MCGKPIAGPEGSLERGQQFAEERLGDRRLGGFGEDFGQSVEVMIEHRVGFRTAAAQPHQLAEKLDRLGVIAAPSRARVRKAIVRSVFEFKSPWILRHSSSVVR